MIDYTALMRAHGVNTATLTAGQLTSITNALHAAYSAGHVSGYNGALMAEHRAHGL